MKRRLRLDLRFTDITLSSLSQRFSRGSSAAAPALLGLALLAGCSGQKIQGNKHKNPTEIGMSDFRAEPGTTTSAQSNQPQNQQETSTELAATESQSTDSTTPLGQPTNQPNLTRQPITSGNDGLEFVDAKVGDINGHPIYVSSFFEPIEDRLIAIGKDMELGRWRQEAGEIINSRLNSIIYDELLRAETIAALTPQQRVGLQSFLKDFRSNVLSENLGSAQLANRRYLEEQGITLDEALRQQELDTLVGLTLYQEINRRINISWRDIKQRYERDIDRYQPDPTITLQVIRVLEPEGELVDSITERLNSGEDFGEIAASQTNTFNRDTQGILEVQLDGEFTETAFFQIDVLNEAVHSLSLGEWTGPVSLGNANFWILYADRVQDSRTLYEAQLEIHRELTQERRAEERKAYLSDLIERARVSSAEEILYRLLFIAERQYGPAR